MIEQKRIDPEDFFRLIWIIIEKHLTPAQLEAIKEDLAKIGLSAKQESKGVSS